MQVILVYRPEIAEQERNPFAGIEVIDILNDDEDALLRVDELSRRLGGEDKGWKWHIDPVHKDALYGSMAVADEGDRQRKSVGLPPDGSAA